MRPRPTGQAGGRVVQQQLELREPRNEFAEVLFGAVAVQVVLGPGGPEDLLPLLPQVRPLLRGQDLNRGPVRKRQTTHITHSNHPGTAAARVNAGLVHT